MTPTPHGRPRRRPRSLVGRWGLLAALAAASTAACGEGYLDLPVPQRDIVVAEIEHLQIMPDALGTLQLSGNVPEGLSAAGETLYVIAPPTIREFSPVTVNWAWGPCRGKAAPPADVRVCVALFQPARVQPQDFVIDILVEARPSGRRVQLSAEVDVP